MVRTVFILMFVALLAGCAKPPAAGQAGSASLTVSDVDGQSHTPLAASSQQARVFIFITTDCPIANGYAPEIARITAAYEPRGIKVYLVHADPDVTADRANQHAKDYRHANTILLDRDQALAKATGATVTPEAVVVSPKGDMLYRGRIDDRYATFGRKREVVTQTELRDALDAILGGRPVPVARTEAIGCHIPL
ncbi:MAG: redoxin family protein [Phycisphaeraceae bacterium]